MTIEPSITPAAESARPKGELTRLCERTLIHVVTDRVAVTSFVNRRHLTVTAGHSYLAKAP